MNRKQANLAYAAAYLVTLLAFGIAVEPEVWEDYARIAALAWALIVLFWIVEIAVRYQRRFHALPPNRRGRMLYPKRIWGMGIAYAVALIPVVREVILLFGEQIVWHSFPVLTVTLAAATYWLWPLRRHEARMQRVEARMSRT